MGSCLTFELCRLNLSQTGKLTQCLTQSKYINSSFNTYWSLHNMYQIILSCPLQYTFFVHYTFFPFPYIIHTMHVMKKTLWITVTIAYAYCLYFYSTDRVTLRATYIHKFTVWYIGRRARQGISKTSLKMVGIFIITNIEWIRLF